MDIEVERRYREETVDRAAGVRGYVYVYPFYVLSFESIPRIGASTLLRS